MKNELIQPLSQSLTNLQGNCYGLFYNVYTKSYECIVSDNKLVLADRVILATDLARIIGYFPSTSVELVKEVLPDSLDLDMGGVGDFVTSRASARSLGINDNHPAMKAV
jgi:hypothetical protein